MLPYSATVRWRCWSDCPCDYGLETALGQSHGYVWKLPQNNHVKIQSLYSRPHTYSEKKYVWYIKINIVIFGYICECLHIPAVGDYIAIALLESQFYRVIRIIQVEQKQGLLAQSHTHLQVKGNTDNQYYLRCIHARWLNIEFINMELR